MQQWGKLLSNYKLFLASVGLATTAAALYYETRDTINDLRESNERVIQAIRENADRDNTVRAVGPDGFTDPSISLGLEVTFARYIRERGIVDKAYMDAVFQLNPTLIKPAGR